MKMLSRRGVAALADRVGLSHVLLRLRGLGGRPWLTIVNYHRVDELSSPTVSGFDAEIVDATPAAFDAQLAVLARYFRCIGLDELRAALKGGALPRNPAMVTFDDGYLSGHDVALPALRRHGLRAVFFIATDAIARRRLFWWDRIHWLLRHARRDVLELRYPVPLRLEASSGVPAMARRLIAIVKQEAGLDLERFLAELTEAADAPWSGARERELADRLVMTWDQVRALRRAGMDIGSHTRSHRILQTLPPAALGEELRGSREDLERELGERVFALAYPDGRAVPASSPIRDAIRAAGYEIGFTYNVGIQRVGRLDPLGVGRVAVEPDVTEPVFRGSLAIPALAQ